MAVSILAPMAAVADVLARPEDRGPITTGRVERALPQTTCLHWVRFATPEGPAPRGAVSGAVPPLYLEGVRSAGGTVQYVSRWLRAASVEAGPDAAARIASLPYVRSITRVSGRLEAASPHSRSTGWRFGAPFPPRRGPAPGPPSPGVPGRFTQTAVAALAPPSDYGSSLAQILSVNAAAAHDSGYSGSGVTVAMLDTGFKKSHPATAALRRLAEHDFVWDDGETENEGPDDPNQWAHGTGTWSILGGYWPSELIGPAFNASFLLAKVKDITDSEPIDETRWLAAMEWADSLGADIISSSVVVRTFFNVPGYGDEDMDGNTALVTLAAREAARRGIVVVSAMGNSGPDPISLWAPSDAESVLAVGALDEDESIWISSARGPTYDGRGKPDVVAPGVGVIWAVAGTDGLGSYPGTSLATPLVGGVAALVREAHPEWTAEQVRYAIKATADRASTADSTTYGYGVPDAVRAIYGSPLGPPVVPKPFSLADPPDSSLTSPDSVTFRWRAAQDLTPDDAVTYEVTVRRVAPDSLIFTGTTADTSLLYADGLAWDELYEWTVTATDLLGHSRECREPFRFVSDSPTAAPFPEWRSNAPRVVLLQSRPNPASGVADFSYRLDGPFQADAGSASPGGSAPVTLRIYDASGRLVRTLIDRREAIPASVTIRWDGRSDDGRRAAPGVYFYQLRAAGTSQARRLVLLR